MRFPTSFLRLPIASNYHQHGKSTMSSTLLSYLPIGKQPNTDRIMQTPPLRRQREKKNTKSPKSSHTGDPLTAALISYLGKDTRLPKTPGNLNGTYNMPKPYSRSTNNGGTSKKRGAAWCKHLCFRAASLHPSQKIVWCKHSCF